MTRFTAALFREQGVPIAVVAVRQHVLDTPSRAEEVRAGCRPLFPGAEIVLMERDYRGVPRYSGRYDIVDFLVRIDERRLPYREWTSNN